LLSEKLRLLVDYGQRSVLLHRIAEGRS